MNKKDDLILLGGENRITLKDCNNTARKGSKVALDQSADLPMNQSCEVLLKYADERVPIYGLNTQFGSQVNMLDANMTNHSDDYHKSLRERQVNLVKSHDCGLGEEAPEEITRSAMMLRAHCLGLGYSGVRPIISQALINFLNKGIHPIIHKYGSIGASGDLIPLSAIAHALIGGKTNTYFKGKKMRAIEAMNEAGLGKLKLEGREGLALINGTSFMTGIAALAVYDMKRLFPQMLSAMAMSLEALMVIGSAYNPLAHELKRHKGSMFVNDFLNDFWKGNKLIQSLTDIRQENLRSFKSNHSVESVKGIQDCYSLRSVPQGFGPFQENLERAAVWIENEMNSVNDNPIVNVKADKIYQAANFMGYYVTESCDVLKMDIAQASTWLHAVFANLVHPRKNSGLPANLVSHPEINNGFRPVQILSASLAVQNRKLAQAQQAFMLPTEGDNQDVNSLAAHAAFDLREAAANLERLTAIMFLAGAQALELRGISKAGSQSKKIHKIIREKSTFVEADRSLAGDIEAVIKLMKEEEI